MPFYFDVLWIASTFLPSIHHQSRESSPLLLGYEGLIVILYRSDIMAPPEKKVSGKGELSDIPPFPWLRFIG